MFISVFFLPFLSFKFDTFNSERCFYFVFDLGVHPAAGFLVPCVLSHKCRNTVIQRSLHGVMKVGSVSPPSTVAQFARKYLFELRQSVTTFSFQNVADNFLIFTIRYSNTVRQRLGSISSNYS
jgi:hypothetical protein